MPDQRFRPRPQWKAPVSQPPAAPQQEPEEALTPDAVRAQHTTLPLPTHQPTPTPAHVRALTAARPHPCVRKCPRTRTPSQKHMLTCVCVCARLRACASVCVCKLPRGPETGTPRADPGMVAERGAALARLVLRCLPACPLRRHEAAQERQASSVHALPRTAAMMGEGGWVSVHA